MNRPVKYKVLLVIRSNLLYVYFEYKSRTNKNCLMIPVLVSLEMLMHNKRNKPMFMNIFETCYHLSTRKQLTKKKKKTREHRDFILFKDLFKYRSAYNCVLFKYTHDEKTQRVCPLHTSPLHVVLFIHLDTMIILIIYLRQE